MEKKLTITEALEVVRKHLTEQIKVDRSPNSGGSSAFLQGMRAQELKHERFDMLDHLTNALTELKVLKNEAEIVQKLVNSDDESKVDPCRNCHQKCSEYCAQSCEHR